VDDFNPLIVTRGLTEVEHDRISDRVNQILEEEGRKEHLE